MRLYEHAKAMESRYGCMLPPVDYEPGVDRRALVMLDCDENLLAKWVVEQHPELSWFEVVVESVVGQHVTVLYGGTTRERLSRHVEYRIVVALETEEDLTWYVDRTTFRLVSREQVGEAYIQDLVELLTPRWVNR